MTHLSSTKDPLHSPSSPTTSETEVSRPSDGRDAEQSFNTALERNEPTHIRPVSRQSQLSRDLGSVYSVRAGSAKHFNSPNDDLRETILASFAPRIAVVASEDTDEIAKEKGFLNGFYGLLRPFAEKVLGKVVVRDSIGTSKAWENFGVRLIQYRHDPQPVVSPTDQKQSRQPNNSRASKDTSVQSSSFFAPDEQQDPTDTILESSLRSTFLASESSAADYNHDKNQLENPEERSSAHLIHIRKLLSGTLQVPYETFSHPVACIIAVSSRNQGPLEEIRQLYSVSGRANIKIPPWVSVDYLRYYVLVHDEDRDDVTKSTALFDLMKRHFGLHCYLLRIRSVQCVETDDDRFSMPECLWTSAAEEKEDLEQLSRHGRSGQDFIFDSDATAIRGFIREMVTQSMIPYMEGRIVTWNDQIASKRRGIGGRFMSLSKKWTGFGSSRGSTSATSSVSTSSSSNYDAARGYYLPESPEAMLRQLADYAFMLRDFKLAFSTYETLRTDFSNDKAWLYHASASELAGVSYLLISQIPSNRSKSEIVDQKIDAALYSYLARCSMPTGAVRALILTIELLTGRGSAAADDAAKWAIRLLDLAILSPFQQALVTERIADINRSQSGSGPLGLGSRRRQSVLWNTLSTNLWAKLDIPGRASIRLHEARVLMGEDCLTVDHSPFPRINSPLHPEQGELGTVDDTLLQLGPTPLSNHFDNSPQAKDEGTDQLMNSTGPRIEPEFGSVDASGFSSISAE